MSDKMEPMLNDEKNRYVIFPIQHEPFSGKCINEQKLISGQRKN